MLTSVLRYREVYCASAGGYFSVDISGEVTGRLICIFNDSCKLIICSEINLEYY